MGFIKGYKDGDNITLLNTIYHRPKKQLDGKYDTGSIDIIYKDMNTNEKKLQHIEDPTQSNVNIENLKNLLLKIQIILISFSIILKMVMQKKMIDCFIFLLYLMQIWI